MFKNKTYFFSYVGQKNNSLIFGNNWAMQSQKVTYDSIKEWERMVESNGFDWIKILDWKEM